MANIKSKKKSIITKEKARVRNASIKSRTRTFIKKAKLAIANDEKNAQKLINDAYKELDKAFSKNVFHKNNVARKKSKLQNLLNSKLKSKK